MGKKKKGGCVAEKGNAPEHGELANNLVHIFVDDQNLFYGITNDRYGPDFRIDFGQLSIMAARDSKGNPRGIGSAYIAGVIPDDDTFWEVAKGQGFTVHRGYLGSGKRSKQDDAYLITEITSTLYEQEGPATIVLVAGDADYGPPLQRAIEKGWRVEIAFIDRNKSAALDRVSHEYRIIRPIDIEYVRD